MDNNEEVLEWKRAQIAIRKFADATAVHLDLLNNHRKTVERLWMARDHHNFVREKCNADRTVRQIVNDMQQMTLIGSNLNKNDLFRFELEVNPLKRKVQNAVREFVDACDKFKLTDDKIDADEEVTRNYADERVNLLATNSKIDYPSLVDELKRNDEAQDQLMQDVSDLNDSMKVLASLIESQHHSVDRIDSNIERTLDNVKTGKMFLKQVAKYKFTMGGALIGAIVGGPAGMVIGMKTAALTAIGGSALGAYSSHLFKKRVESRRNSSVQNEMKPIMNSSSSHEKIG